MTGRSARSATGCPEAIRVTRSGSRTGQAAAAVFWPPHSTAFPARSATERRAFPSRATRRFTRSMSPSDSLPDPTGAPGDAVPGARFPPDFLWGVATSAYQIEGSPLADGAGASNWHAFSHTPGRIANGDTGDVACDHYRRYAGDISLIRQLGAAAYRFSVAWSRIVPAGTGAVNRAGLDFYSRLVDELLGNNIKPCVTLYHWDHPAALDDRGGWLNRDMAEWFAEYTSRVMRALGDRVHM